MTEQSADHGSELDADIEIRLLETTADIRRLVELFNQVWGTSTDVVGIELIRAIGHAGGYVAAAFVNDDQMVGGSVGFLGRHRDQPTLHSHLTGVLPGVRHTGLGRAIKLHQRAWAAERDLGWITWTFDPLVRANAWFNLGVLGAEVHEYLVDFYGPIDDSINAGDESDRLLVAWAVADAAGAERAQEQETFTVPTPDDIVVLRRTSPAEADGWRRRVRLELAGPLEAGGRVVGFTRDGDYLVVRGRRS